ncbi:MAG: hypothetical protein GQ546_09895 [Gammaproteobacteria bacterium]|nr:hypothetical protein [Gammaproteobacteria bacterium]
MSKSTKLFIFLSLTIALIDVLFVTTNYYYARNTLEQTLQDESKNDFAIYQTVLDSTYNDLSIQATLFAGDSRIQELFLAGKKALELEGGDSGGTKTAIIRNKLYNLVSESWNEASKKFDIRHLHFHLGPGSLSFLRVHQANKFGDRLDKLRFLIVDTNAQQSPKSGFETGRVSSGLRSAVPIFAWDKTINKKVYVGALEVSTSYKKLLETIKKNININTSILLNRQHIENTVWDEFITGKYNNDTIKDCDCVLEASSGPSEKTFIEHITQNINFKNQLLHADAQVKTIAYNNQSFAITFHPLRDYLGMKVPSRKNIGSILISRNINELMSLYKEKQLFNIFYGIIAYFIVEFLLILTFLNVTKHLTSQVKIQTQELSEQKNQIELDKLKYKNLADAINAHYFFYSRDSKNNFTFVSPSIKHVLGCSQEDFLNNAMHYFPTKSRTDMALKTDNQTPVDNNKNSFEIEACNKSGRRLYLLVTETPKLNDHNQISIIDGLAQDISTSRQETMLLKLRCHILQLMSDKHSKEEILNELVLGIEAIIRDIQCAIMLFDKQKNTLSVGAAPSLPFEFLKSLNNLALNLNNPVADTSNNTACVIAASTLKRKIISDLQLFTSGLISSEILEQTAYKASCSEPVLSSKAKILATIDFYYKQTGHPSESDLLILAAARDLISTLLE